MAEDKYESLLQEVQGLDHVDGVIPTALLELPESIALLIREMMRQGSMTVDELAAFLELSVSQADDLGEALVAKGYLVSDTTNAREGQVYRVFYARVRKRNLPPELF
jgi:hypothetical protein